MVSIAPPKAIDPLPTQTHQQQQSVEANPAAEAAERRIAAFEEAQRAETQPGKVLVQLDPDAQRFVATLTDSATSEMLRRYPSESQLAYSRAVMAYLRAQIGK
jgi:hypothetical protein